MILSSTVFMRASQRTGGNATGDQLHKEALLQALSVSELFEKKGERVALNRWFSWVKAAKAKESLWHLMLWVVLHLGLESGVYNSLEKLPLFKTTEKGEQERRGNP